MQQPARGYLHGAGREPVRAVRLAVVEELHADDADDPEERDADRRHLGRRTAAER